MNRGTMGFSRISKPSANLIQNGSFDNNLNAWFTQSPASIAWVGSTMRVSRANAAIGVWMSYQDLVVEFGKYYALSFDFTYRNVSTTQLSAAVHFDESSSSSAGLAATSPSVNNILLFKAVGTRLRLTLKPTNNTTGIAGVDNVILVRVPFD